MDPPQIDLAWIKAEANAEQVFACCGLRLLGRGEQRQACCPFHDDRRPSLAVNLAKKVFFCHACGETGDLITFVVRHQGCSPLEAACRIAGWCGLPTRPCVGALTARKRAVEAAAAEEDTGRGQNPPLGFRLTLDPGHPYLAQRGLSREIIDRFGLGYCASGLMTGRICIPIHRSEDGALIAYAGRWAGETVPNGVRRYLLPRHFRKSLILFNLDRVWGSEHLVLVEGFFGAFAVAALEVPVVALMGRSLSARQEELLRESGIQRLTLLLDGDGPGRRATEALLPRLARSFFVREAELPDGAQPDTIGMAALRDTLQLA